MAKQRAKKKYFTAAEANGTLPLVRRIVTDIATLANDLQERSERLERAGSLSAAHQEERKSLEEEFERDKDRLTDYAEELQQLGVVLKDPFTGLVDFPCWLEDREVLLCWRLGEPEVAFWHELDAGFAGRQSIASII